ncbi:MAG: hypothetical protein K9G61_03420 [Bacteroidales bacterium]|nr:hypothetical protein [Bacteroidota bacterium]MCF8347843.1 hypothetical protein [Bacteroidales bacterium]
MRNANTYTVQLLLVEHCPKKIGKVKQVLDDSKVKYELHLVRDVDDTHHFLHRTGKYAKAPKPDAILLTDETTPELETKIRGFLNHQILHLHITDNTIEIVKANHQSITSGKSAGNSLGYFLQAILSAKKFAGSLITKNKAQESNNQ